MSEPNDIGTEKLRVPDPEDENGDPRETAYRIAVWVMEEFQPGFVIVGSPNMAETDAGYLYPDAVGIIINNEIELTPFGLGAVLESLAEQLNSNIEEVTNYLKDQNDSE